jgi:hypothetical protein
MYQKSYYDEREKNEALRADLAAALEKIEVQRFLQADFDALVIQYERREADLAAANASAEVAEQDVVGLRSHVKLTKMVLKEFEEKLCSISEEARKVLAACPNHRSPPMVHPFWDAMDALELALCVPSPCSHAVMLGEAERKLCAAKDLAERYVSIARGELLAALSSSSPCRHAAEVDAMREAERFIEKRLEHCVSDQRGAYQDVLAALRGLKEG